MVTLAIQASHSQRVRGNVDGVEIGQARLMYGNANRNGSAARADICHERDLPVRQALLADGQSGLDKDFRLRAWNKHAPVYSEIQPVEFFVPGQISYRFALCAPGQQLLPANLLRGI